MEPAQVEVGIISGKEISFVFRTPYCYGNEQWQGEYYAVWSEGKICWNNNLYEELIFIPESSTEALFELPEVTIGINFHWERTERQLFPGILKLIVEGEKLTAVNIVSVETYLTSVISSEMSAEASLELLKAHAVISRSWLLHIIENGKKQKKANTGYAAAVIGSDTSSEHIVWYDHQAHIYFDVCADDHCQRYQGMTRVSSPTVRKAVEETCGQILMYENGICDARFSKCCGGAMEEFRFCWEDKNIPYLKSSRDSKTATKLPDLTDEAEAGKWIRSRPEAFCHTHDKKILSQVLNNYDRETTGFYRWKAEYSHKELSELVCRRSGIDFGEIMELQPVERGKSGRLVKLRIVGSKRTLIIGKELEIRRVFSPAHLYSSAFVVDKTEDCFVLTGAGWGHGVGLCQIGAAVMGERGYKYDEILFHYYVGASIKMIYGK